MFFRQSSRKEDIEEATCVINKGQPDQMVAVGYTRDSLLSALSIFSSIISLGLMQLAYFWWPKLRISLTHRPVRHSLAEILVITENYGTHGILHIEKIWEVDVLNRKAEGIHEKTNLPHPASPNSKGWLRMVEIKKVRFVWIEGEGDNSGHWVKLSGIGTGLTCADLHRLETSGLEQRKLMRQLYGPNIIMVSVDSYLKLFIEEVGNPFYFFLVFSLVLWLIEVYVFYSVSIILMTLFGLFFATKEARTNQERLQQTVGTSTIVKLLTTLGEKGVSSEDLVPGDIILLQENQIIPCDAILLSGTCTVNESMLTGESVPQIKTPVGKLITEMYNFSPDHTLFCGTKVVRARGRPVAVVSTTGFSTTKGELVRSILYPPPADYIFDKGTYRLILFIGLSASICSMINFIYLLSKYGIGKSILHSLDLITIAIPASLPGSMTACKIFAARRLRKNQIYCINSRVINVVGSIDSVCFDKTGTLTEDELDVSSVVGTGENGAWHEPMSQLAALDTYESHLYKAMASCHSLTLLKNGSLSGDPLDFKMFEWTKWKYLDPDDDRSATCEVESPDSQVRLSMIKQFQFSSSLQRQGVIMADRTKDEDQPDRLIYYAKGAPETIASLCNPDTVPKDLTTVLEGYTSQGFRVLALSWSPVKEKEHTEWERAQLEENMTFAGLLILENKIKPATKPTIDTLRKADIKLTIITGDHMATACHVGQECSIISSSKVIQLDLSPEGKIITNILNLKETKKEFNHDLNDLEKGLNLPDYQLAVSGAAWNHIYTNWDEMSIKNLLCMTAVYARMSSVQKQEVVSALQKMGSSVAMCGDGANDCSALKAANVGVSLSEAEASAASPFTSRIQDVSCVIHVIREGRAAVTSAAAIFKFLLTYCFIQYVSSNLLYIWNSQLDDLQYLYIDLFVMLSVVIWFGKTEGKEGPPATRLPPKSVISATVLLPIISLCLVTLATQGVAYLLALKYPYGDSKISNIDFVVWSVANHQYMVSAVVFSRGQVWRKPIYSNRWLSTSIFIVTVVNTFMLFTPKWWLSEILHLNPPSGFFLPGILLALVASSFITAWLFDSLIDWVMEKYFTKKGYRAPDSIDWLWQSISTTNKS